MPISAIPVASKTVDYCSIEFKSPRKKFNPLRLSAPLKDGEFHMDVSIESTETTESSEKRVKITGDGRSSCESGTDEHTGGEDQVMSQIEALCHQTTMDSPRITSPERKRSKFDCDNFCVRPFTAKSSNLMRASTDTVVIKRSTLTDSREDARSFTDKFSDAREFLNARVGTSTHSSQKSRSTTTEKALDEKIARIRKQNASLVRAHSINELEHELYQYK